MQIRNPDPGSKVRNLPTLDSGYGILGGKIRIQNAHPGSATLLFYDRYFLRFLHIQCCY
jgi:hypothetical protein